MLKTPEAVKHSNSDHARGISAPSFCTDPLWVAGRRFLNQYNIEAVLNKRQPGDSAQKQSKQTIFPCIEVF